MPLRMTEKAQTILNDWFDRYRDRFAKSIPGGFSENDIERAFLKEIAWGLRASINANCKRDMERIEEIR